MNERENSLSFFVTYPSDMFNILHPYKGIIHIPLSEFLKTYFRDSYPYRD